MRKTIVVTYSGLKSTSEMVEGLRMLIPDGLGSNYVGGFQRALITTKTPDGDLTDAYSVSCFFVVYDGEVGDVQFLREPRRWTNEEVKRRLRKPTIERIVLQDETGKLVTVTELREQFYETPEDYLLHAFDETFPKLKRELGRAINDEDELRRELAEPERTDE